MGVRALVICTVMGVAAACGSGGTDTSPAPGTAAETARLNAWFEARYAEQLARSPIQTTILGRKDNYDAIDDMTEAAADAELAWWRQSVQALERDFDRDALTPEAQTSWDIWLDQAAQAEQAARFRRHGYVFTQMQGPQAFLPSVLLNFHRVDDVSDLDAYVRRIGAVATAIEQLLARAQAAAGDGIRPPAFAFEGVREQASALVTGAPFAGAAASPIWADVTAKIAALEAAGTLDAAAAEAQRTAARAALTGRFKPAFDALIAWCDAELPTIDRAATGVSKLPQGRAFYAERLAASTTTTLTAAQIHQIGLDEVAHITAEMEALKQRVGFPGTLQAFFTFMRDDPQFFFPNTDAGREGYLQAARDYLGGIEARLPQYFGLLPKASLIVKRVEPFREQDGAAQHYFPGTPDGSRPGVYYAHLSDMAAMPKPQMESIAYHEGNPGHHMQISIAQELQGLPEFRTQAGYTAYSEGWGLYAEQLAKEMGAFEDPYSDFGRLTSEMWRAIRLVVDTGLHDKEWTEEQAVAYFKEHSPVSDGQIRSEVRRYIVWPGQATAYKIGMLRILELRERARTQLGDRFDIKGFHDTVLGGGAMPLSVLERRVDAWIASRRAS